MKPHQIITLMQYAGTDNTLAMADHDDHIHVGFHPTLRRQPRSSASAARPRSSSPSQWTSAGRPPRQDRQPARCRGHAVEAPRAAEDVARPAGTTRQPAAPRLTGRAWQRRRSSPSSRSSSRGGSGRPTGATSCAATPASPSTCSSCGRSRRRCGAGRSARRRSAAPRPGRPPSAPATAAPRARR